MGLIALSLDSEGELGMSDIIWKQSYNISEVPTPLVYDGRIYMVKDGGTLTCMDAKTGRILFKERIGTGGPYFASPIAANGFIYIPSNTGVIIVIEASDHLTILEKNDIGERIYATPAIVGNYLYVRTERQLFSFGNDMSF